MKNFAQNCLNCSSLLHITREAIVRLNFKSDFSVVEARGRGGVWLLISARPCLPFLVSASGHWTWVWLNHEAGVPPVCTQHKLSFVFDFLWWFQDQRAMAIYQIVLHWHNHIHKLWTKLLDFKSLFVVAKTKYFPSMMNGQGALLSSRFWPWPRPWPLVSSAENYQQEPLKSRHNLILATRGCANIKA